MVTNPPKALLKARTDLFNGFPIRSLGFYALFGFGIIIPILVINLSLSIIGVVLSLLYAFPMLAIFIKYFSTVKRIDLTFIYIGYLFRKTFGYLSFHKFKDDLKKTMAFFSIVDIFGFVIQFSDNRYGAIMKVEAPHVEDSNVESQKLLVKKCLDGLPPYIWIKVIKTCVPKLSNPSEKYILNVIKDNPLTPEQKEHLLNLLDYAGAHKFVNTWSYYISFYIKDMKNAEMAESKFNAFFPGFERNLRSAGITGKLLSSKAEILNTYLELITMRYLR